MGVCVDGVENDEKIRSERYSRVGGGGVPMDCGVRQIYLRCVAIRVVLEGINDVIVV